MIASRLFVALLAALAIAAGLAGLRDGAGGIVVTHTSVGDTPITVFRTPSTSIAPVVVIAHGFAGSQQLMLPFAQTLARNGYIAVTFDFLGHGRNPHPMRGNITEGETITFELVRELGEVAAAATALPGSDGRLAVLGHSMASDIVVRFAQAHPEVVATVAVSVFSPVATAASPRNLLVIVGALEPAMLRNEGRRIVGLAAGGNAVAGETYGNFADGTARRLVLAPGVEHIGVLYSHDSLIEALRWLNAALGQQQVGFIDSRGGWLALLFLGIIALAWPLSTLLPVIQRQPPQSDLSWRALLIAALVPALLTPLILWKMPTDFLPILLGDYLALHFLIYGALTFACLRLLRRSPPTQRHLRCHRSTVAMVAAAALAVAAYNIIAFGLPMDSYLFSFIPIPKRLPLIAAIGCSAIPYFIADEWLTRGHLAPRGAYPLTKLCFVLSLGLAVALNPMKLFFLVIIAPAILLLFLAFGVISRWSYLATHHPLPGALGNAAVFAWAIGVTFPMITR